MGMRPENISVYNIELIISRGYERTYSAHIAKPHWMARLFTMGELKAFDAVLVGGGDGAILCREMVRTGMPRPLEIAYMYRADEHRCSNSGASLLRRISIGLTNRANATII